MTLRAHVKLAPLSLNHGAKKKKDESCIKDVNSEIDLSHTHCPHTEEIANIATLITLTIQLE